MKNYNSIKTGIKDGYIKVTKSKIQVLADCYYLVEAKDKNFVTINPKKKTITCFVNFFLNFKDDYRILINFNDVLEPSYDYYEETPEGYKCYLNENSYLFETNTFALSKNNSNNMLSHFLNGKLGSDEMPYKDIYTTFKSVMEKSGLPKLESLSYELLISEATRIEGDLSKPFRIIASPVKQHGYVSIKLKDIGKGVSAITALNSEDITDSMATILMAKKNKQKPVLTPVERITLNKFD